MPRTEVCKGRGGPQRTREAARGGALHARRRAAARGGGGWARARGLEGGAPQGLQPRLDELRPLRRGPARSVPLPLSAAGPIRGAVRRSSCQLAVPRAQLPGLPLARWQAG